MPTTTHILIIKTSSLGDVIHTLPALSDAQRHQPDIQFDWVVEENFSEIPQWHPAVQRVIPVALRRWRKHLYQTWRSGEWQGFKKQLRAQNYDYVIDTQGLIKSAWLTWHTKGLRCGFDKHSAREAWASWSYQQGFYVTKQQHAVERVRQLFAQVLGYATESLPLDYGISSHFQSSLSSSNNLVFLHGTTWNTKLLPEILWTRLAERAIAAGFGIRLAWGNTTEYQRAMRIAAISDRISLIEKGNLYHLATELQQARAVIGVDTGLAHLAAALRIPSITIYGATTPQRTGTYHAGQVHLTTDFACSPCFRKFCRYGADTAIFPPCYATVSLDTLWQQLELLLKN